MGVDSCGNCGETFTDCGPHAKCHACGVMLCPDCMEKLDACHPMADLSVGCLSSNEYSQCSLCAKTVVNDKILLEFVMGKLDINRDMLTETYRGNSKASDGSASEELDNTPFAHPAFWRGQDDGVLGVVRKIENILDGNDDGAGVCASVELEKLRRRLLEMVK
jgi:hypothetical protein